MLWVTRSRIRVNRAATGWLIRRFIDPDAMFRFVDPDQVASVQRDHCATGFDAPGARYPHKDGLGRCSFEALVEEHQPWDPALRRLALIVHCADFPDQLRTLGRRAAGSIGTLDRVSLAEDQDQGATASLEAVGLRAISYGFPLVAADDLETLERSAFLYDSLYAALQDRQVR
ncbi:MAG TPA: chromate resistance protein ChrB domain-containing protein [Gemmatimonadales bacterium]|nr:chromate resistance protein ChrB domain-containing protein [Gemmatimonadales bacterium]